MSACLFCRIVAGEVPASVVYEDEQVLAFLDIGPVFHGHTLVVPKTHADTLLDLPDHLSAPLLAAVRLIGRAVESGLGAQGSFVAVNNRVSQTVPHLHVHVMPRSRGDGMKGFFWPRRPYRDDEQREQVRAMLARAVAALRGR
ncbi:MAG: HIT family protein [Bryobacteraceae bacterium]|nr:HIT family protein [Bryobacteraceae bacterium]